MVTRGSAAPRAGRFSIPTRRRSASVPARSPSVGHEPSTGALPSVSADSSATVASSSTVTRAGEEAGESAAPSAGRPGGAPQARRVRARMVGRRRIEGAEMYYVTEASPGAVRASAAVILFGTWIFGGLPRVPCCLSLCSSFRSPAVVTTGARWMDPQTAPSTGAPMGPRWTATSRPTHRPAMAAGPMGAARMAAMGARRSSPPEKASVAWAGVGRTRSLRGRTSPMPGSRPTVPSGWWARTRPSCNSMAPAGPTSPAKGSKATRISSRTSGGRPPPTSTAPRTPVWFTSTARGGRSSPTCPIPPVTPCMGARPTTCG